MRLSEIRPGVRRLLPLALRRAADARADADEEIRLHLALRTEQLITQGAAPAAARAEAERRFGPLDEARGRLHSSAQRREDTMRFREWLGGLGQTLRVTARGLRRAPGFVFTAVTCIALGVGANAAAFSLLDELILRPLPVAHPEQLVNFGAPGPRVGGDQCGLSGECEEVVSYPMYRDLERLRPAALSGIAGHRIFIASVTAGERAAEGEGAFVSGSYFPVLGLRPALGRLLTPDDDAPGGGRMVAVLSHAYWSTHLGADPSIVGRQIRVNDRSLTVVGVAPAGFDGTTLGSRLRVFVPLSLSAAVDPFFGAPSELQNRTRYYVYLFGRRAPGASIDQVRAAMQKVYRPILADVDAPLQEGMSAPTLARFKARELTVGDGSRGQSRLRGSTRAPLTFLFAITALVVVIACANIANLLLARGAGRATEVAVRMSLGAGRRQLVAQLLVESVVLAALGGVASLAVAGAVLRVIRSFVPPAMIGGDAVFSLGLRPGVFLFAGAVSLGTGLLFGLFPALHATRADLIASIRSGAGQIAGGQRSAARFRTTLVTAQIALSLALLASAGLFVRSLRNVGRVDLGMAVDRVATFGLLPELNGYDAARARALLQRAEEEVGALPGVTGAAVSSVPLLTGSNSGNNIRLEGYPSGPDTDMNVRVNQVGPAFFRTLGIPLLAGRAFSAADRFGAPKVAIVTEAFARKFNMGRDVVGRRVAVRGAPGAPLDIEIVGLARDARYSDVKGDPPALLYTPYRQDSSVTAAAFYVRGTLPATSTLRSLPPAVARLDRALPLVLLRPMALQVRENVYLDRMIGTLSSGFALLATLLAAVGLYGVLAYTVTQRTKEIGVRMALGADGGRIRRMVLGQVARMLLVGGAAGIAATFGIGRAAESLLFGLRGNDPLVVGAAAVVLTAVALGAGYLPARRASRVPAMTALRGE